MTMTDKISKKTYFSLFIFHFSLLMFTSVASADFSRDDSIKIVTDNETGLQWQDDEMIQKNWQDAISYCKNLTLGSYDDWRLPNINELSSIIDDTKYNPSMSPVFQSFMSNRYWSSTSHVNYGYGAWIVYFSSGVQGNYVKNNLMYVRCVRAGQ